MKFAVTFLIALCFAISTASANPEGRASDVGPTPASVDTNSVVEKQYERLLEADDAAQEEVDQWIREHREFASKGAASDDAALVKRIRERFAPVKKDYESFLARHPDHTRARIAYAGFLGDIEGEEAAQAQLEKALSSDTNNPAVYNNLANIYGHSGDVKKAFDFYSRAIKLNPSEPVYYHNFGTTVYLFRKDAKEFYDIDEQAVFNKAFDLYSNALRLDPTNFPLASDVAQSYYGVRPLRPAQALAAWTNALSLAHDEIEREGVYVHFARINMLEGKYDEARRQLTRVTNDMYAELKSRITRSIESREKEEKEGTGSKPKAPEQKPQEKNDADKAASNAGK